MADQDLFSNEPITDEEINAQKAPVATPPAPVDANASLFSSTPMESDGGAEVSQPPVPQATTLLTDKNVVVGHPMDMSHDQVNDAIQTSIYGRLRNYFFHDADPAPDSHWQAFTQAAAKLAPVRLATSLSMEDAKSLVPEATKGAVIGAERLGVGLGGLLKWMGDLVPNSLDYTGQVGATLSTAGDNVVDFFKKAQESKLTAPDPEIFRGSFVSNPSWSRAASMVTSQVPMLGAATALTIATGNPLAGAEFLGLTTAGESYEAAKEEGSSTARASVAAGLSGIGNAIFMSLPMGKVLSGFGQSGAESVLRGASEFTTLNAAMTPFNNIVARIGGDKARKLFDGWTESLISGAISGGTLGAIFPHGGSEIDAMTQEAHNAGVPSKDMDAARAEIAKQMSENPVAIASAIEQAKSGRMANQMVDQANAIVEANPEHQQGATAVYDDIKSRLEGVQKPVGISDEDWAKQIDASAKLWLARTVTEAQKRGTSVEDVYNATRPTIIGDNSIQSGDFLQPAYHGTPHKFDEFSLHKIGTGQGAQSYGWGLYFAGAKDVAEHYREQLAGKLVVTNWKIGDFHAVKNEEYRDYSPKTSTHEDTAKSAIIEDILINQSDLEAEFSSGGEKAVKKAILAIIDDKIKTYKDEWPEAVQAAEKFRSTVDHLGVKMSAEKPGHIYTVDIPDDHKYMDWEKPFSKQSPEIQKAVLDLAKEKPLRLTEDMSGGEIYRQMTDLLGSPKEASLFLSGKGIPGLKYLDQMSRDQGKGTSNYVLFDDKLIKITNFYQNQNGGGQNPRGSTRFTPEGTVISLMKNADASTFLHESAHVWLKDIHDFIKTGNANEKYQADWSTLKDWLGVEKNKDDLTVAQHEKFAKGFEKYLREGVSPSPELKPVFDRFKEWLRNVYQSAKTLKVNLSANVRGVMDRMLATPEEPFEGKYVKNRQYEIAPFGTDQATAKDIRTQFAGVKNEQIVRGNQLADEIRRDVPNKADREGMFWYKAANGDIEILSNALDDPKLEKYHDQILRALSLSDKAKASLKKVDQYYTESGAVAQDIGTISNIRENYQNRIYKPEPPKDFVKTETKAGLKQTTSHAKARVFDTEFEAAQAGKEFATTDVADSLSIHNEEMARVNASRKLADSLQESGLGGWKKDQPDGWEQVGTMEKRVPIRDENGDAVIGEDGNQAVSASKFYAPKGIAKGLAAIVDGNFTKKIDSLRGIQKYQGLVKTVDLSYSFFHHFSMAMQAAYQGGFKTLLNLPKMEKMLASPEFADIETDFTKYTGMTSNVEATQDILRNLVEHQPDTFSKITELPGVKQVLKGAEKGGNFLFSKLQRYLKVMDYGEKISNWVADNPDATNEQIKAAKIGFARNINAVYGGLNWEAIGMTKSNLSLLRIGLLAPDWTISNIQLLEQALGEKGTAGQSSRKHILTALIGGIALTEGVNKILTGHYTDDNPKGHKLEVEISPNVYISFLRGGIGDITKLASMMSESGLAAGSMRFAQGKLAPIARTAIGLASNTQYTGAPIYKRGEGHNFKNDYDILKYLLSSLGPVPLGLSNVLQYLQEPDKTISGAATVVSGIGRYSKSGGGGSSTLKM